MADVLQQQGDKCGVSGMGGGGAGHKIRGKGGSFPGVSDPEDARPRLCLSPPPVQVVSRSLPTFH